MHFTPEMYVMTLGAVGALICGGVCGIGVFIGWKLRGLSDLARRPPLPRAQPPNDEYVRRMREREEAFQRVQNYSVEDAYGMREEGGGMSG